MENAKQVKIVDIEDIVEKTESVTLGLEIIHLAQIIHIEYAMKISIMEEKVYVSLIMTVEKVENVIKVNVEINQDQSSH